MFKIIKKILGLCNHKWKVINIGKVSDTSTNECWHKYHLQCQKCGGVKIHSTR